MKDLDKGCLHEIVIRSRSPGNPSQLSKLPGRWLLLDWFSRGLHVLWGDSSRHAQVVGRLRWFEFLIHAIDASLPIFNENTFVGFIRFKMTVYQFLTGRKKSSKIDRGRNFSNTFSALYQENISEGLLPLFLIVLPENVYISIPSQEFWLALYFPSFSALLVTPSSSRYITHFLSRPG